MTRHSLIDTNVQPFFRSNSEILRYLPKYYQTRSVPDVESVWYQAPGGDYLKELYENDWLSMERDPLTMQYHKPDASQTDVNSSEYPGSNPETVSHYLFGQRDTEIAILNPLTRGNHPDYRLNSAICTGINEWLSQRWLDAGNTHGRFRGTIRVNPEDPPAAIKEIERFSQHPYMVQVGVPLQSREPYGKPQFTPIWEAAAEHGLPVAVRITGGAGVEYAPTPVGHPRTYPNYAAFMPLNYFYHLSSLIAEGIFERIPELKFVFADGGLDMLAPLIWRMDTIWYSARDMTPWLTRCPSSYLPDHVRFCGNKLEGPFDDAIRPRWLKILNHSDLLMFGSSYPYWYCAEPADLWPNADEDERRKLLHDNAVDLFCLSAKSVTR